MGSCISKPDDSFSGKGHALNNSVNATSRTETVHQAPPRQQGRQLGQQLGVDTAGGGPPATSAGNAALKRYEQYKKDTTPSKDFNRRYRDGSV
ncbi:hypothetical protein GGH19_005367 [Coemansia sp. RSA 1807]|nr:hypothetical protein GGH17_002424 [Coemansia sp. RSA 788]KAJ2140321.1 hypothetical protein IW142_005463 [Coemansia sp. RSA 564]KAJ2186408.1 hypothetical protein EV181_003315 [Coemansia sp. RSA 532]KAJ2197524.1 hypothetical protein GGH18_001292 [Coemansia sp. RSA 530]KAJ2227024.1 hypothetical protein EV180_002647 [Coemansia sp. RSA 518]KAJ2248034.1 hypothetical protein GGH97_001891 [Coemansia sp. RSA 475]KAJ2271961.1 hypothetical protein J3F81_003249 [Coemansia sp. RSA 371]KAJ2276902.1 hyp